jgi:hypothetical protein
MRALSVLALSLALTACSTATPPANQVAYNHPAGVQGYSMLGITPNPRLYTIQEQAPGATAGPATDAGSLLEGSMAWPIVRVK